MTHAVRPPSRRTQKLIDRMLAADQAWAADAARDVLEADWDNIDALVILAREAPSRRESVALLIDAVRIGFDQFGLFGSRNPPRSPLWWRDPETRPLMRALKALAVVLVDAGRGVEAAYYYKLLMAMDPADNVGVSQEIEPASRPKASGFGPR